MITAEDIHSHSVLNRGCQLLANLGHCKRARKEICQVSIPVYLQLLDEPFRKSQSCLPLVTHWTENSTNTNGQFKQVSVLTSLLVCAGTCRSVWKANSRLFCKENSPVHSFLAKPCRQLVSLWGFPTNQIFTFYKSYRRDKQ